MHKLALSLFSTAMIATLAACGGGGGGASGPLPGGSQNNQSQSQSIVPEDLFSLNNSDLLNTLELDAGFAATSTVSRQTESTRAMQSAGPFAMQITGGNATVARGGTQTTSAIGFLLTYRDASGFCECSNDNTTLPPPYKTVITNPQWGASPFGTRASTTTLGIALKNNVNNANQGGTYTATVNNPPGGSATFGIGNPAATLARQSVPTVTTNASGTTVSWTGAPGTKEYFVAFLTHLNNDPVKNPGYTVVGFVVTDKSTVTVPAADFYPNAKYQALLISADTKYIGVYLSQGQQQLPQLPPQIDFTVSPIAPFTTTF